MFSTIDHLVRGMFASGVIIVSTVIHATILIPFTLAKLLAPDGRFKSRTRHQLGRIAESWIALNNRLFSLHGTRWDIEIPQDLNHEGCYIVNCNHQSWVDIPILQLVFNRRLPFLRFFLKSELIWVPVLGAAWWALDFPFMKRASSAQLKRKPSLQGKDLENARVACEKFKEIPVAMMNFAEGTRFSEAKREHGKSPYRYLLKPRIGGIGQVLYALGDELDSMIDVTIIYPGRTGRGNPPSMWDLLSGQIDHITLRARKIEIPTHLRGRNFRSDRGFRGDLEAWIRDMWVEKDQEISRLK
jgi:1-acyl-sn-glycerol-3-phosphate acyltransferase